MSVAVIGGGGHAKVVVDALERCGAQVAGVVDEGRPMRERLWGTPVVPAIEDIAADGFVVAIGDNRRRRERFDFYCRSGYRPVTVVHPATTLGRGVTVGAGSFVAAGACVNSDTVIGPNTIINTGASVDHDCRIGAHVHVAPGVRLAGGVAVGEGVLLGIGTVVTPMRLIGAWAVCGAGAVVVGDVPPSVVAKGVLARWVPATGSGGREAAHGPGRPR